MFTRLTAACILVISLFASACRQTESTPPVSGEVSFALSGTEWTYFCFETGKVVGISAFGDAGQDAAWAERTDWDIAFCGDYIRTNSGASGVGYGGILRNTTDNFYSLQQAPEEGYLTDTDDFVVYD